MEIALIGLLATALFAIIGLLATALFQLRRQVQAGFAGLGRDIAELRGELAELRAEVAELRGRFDAHIEQHAL